MVGRRQALTDPGTALALRAMEPQVTERDVALLMLNEQALLALGAVLGWQARSALTDRGAEAPSALEMLLPA